LQEFVNIDYQRKLLSFHGSYDCLKFFRELDTDNKGYLTAENFSQYYSENVDFSGFNFENLIQYISPNGNSRITYVELKDAFTPYGRQASPARHQRGYGSYGGAGSYGGSGSFGGRGGYG
jgi:Ca2+-binding EF-hand superfamily protein